MKQFGKFLLSTSCLLVLFSSCTVNQPFAPAFLMDAGQTGIQVRKGVEKNPGNVTVNQKTYTLYGTTSHEVFLCFQSKNVQKEYQNTISYRDYVVDLDPIAGDKGDAFYSHRIPIHRYALSNANENVALSITFTSGQRFDLPTQNYNNFYLKDVYLLIQNQKYYAKEYASDELFFGEATSTVNSRISQVSEQTYDFVVDKKLFDTTGTLIDDFVQEEDVTVAYQDKSSTIPAAVAPQWMMNLEDNAVKTDTWTLESSFGSQGMVETYWNGIKIANRLTFDSSAWPNGEHELTFIGKHPLGFISRKTVPFTLQSSLTQRSVAMEVAAHHASDRLPSTWNHAEGKVKTNDVLSPFGNIAYQTIEVAKDGENTFFFTGEVPPHRLVYLQVFDVTKNSFETIAVTKPKENRFEIAAKVDILYAKSEKFFLRLVSQMEALKASDITDQVAWISDPQNIVEKASLTAGSRNAIQALNSMRDAILEEYNKNRLSFLAITGDIVQSTNIDKEWVVFQEEFMQAIVDAKIPYGAAPGNHDIGGLRDLCNQKAPEPVESGSDCLEPYLDYSFYAQYFGDKAYAHLPTHGKQIDPELGSFKDSRSHFDRVTIGNQDYLFLFLGWGSTVKGMHVAESDIAWAKQVLAKYTSERVILLTHDYMGARGLRTATGDVLYKTLVEPYANVDFVFSGHINGSSSRIDYLDSNQDGLKERRVLQMLFDYQEEENAMASSAIRYLKFAHDSNQLFFDTYSPYTQDGDIELTTNINGAFIRETAFYRYGYDILAIGYGLKLERSAF